MKTMQETEEFRTLLSSERLQTSNNSMLLKTTIRIRMSSSILKTLQPKFKIHLEISLSQKAEYKDKGMDRKREQVRKLEAQSQGFSNYLVGILERENRKKVEENLGDNKYQEKFQSSVKCFLELNDLNL